jgi:sulfonate transport system permease protein
LRRRSSLLVSVSVLLAIAALWELASLLSTSESVPGEPLIPGWEVIATDTFVGLSDYWQGGLGVEAVAEGGQRTYRGAILAILSNSLDTTIRLYTGLALGAVVGIAAGLAVSWSTWTRRTVALPGQILRTLPLLAFIPLFQLWFGISFRGMVIFIAIAVGVIFFTGTVNAVSNISPIYAEYARTLGASRVRIYRTVVLPAMFPELRSTILLALGVAWTAVIGAEFLGAQTGLGQIVVFAKYFGYVDRMFLIGLIVLIYATITYAIFERISRRLTVWMPSEARDRVL